MNPRGDIGIVMNDDNGFSRILEVKFEDGLKQDLWLSNTGDNPEESRNWSWEYKDRDTNKMKWVKWGK